MGRNSDWSVVGMNSDPTPGDPERVRQLSVRLQNFADDAEEALSKVQALVNDGGLASFVGLTAEAFRDRFDKVPPNLTKLHTSYDLAASALARYWPRLEAAQSEADSALTEAVDAKAELDAARARLATALTTLEGAEDAADPPDEDEVSQEVKRALADAKTAHGTAETAVANAENRLEIAIGLARQAKEAREEAAEDCASDLDEASDAGMQNKKWWQKAVDWVVDNWDTIVAIAKVVVAVLGIIVMIIGGPLAWIVLAAALIVLADTLIKYANGQASLWDVAFAALDCIPGFKGLTTAAGLMKGLKTGMKGMAAGAKGLGKNLKNRAGQMFKRNTCGDPVDVANGDVVLSETDVELPGILPLVLERHHISSHRDGRWFGRSWASTLDQRLVLEDNGARYHSEDGMTLVYPVPLRDPEHAVMPVEGPRWGLAWNGTPGSPMTIHRRETGHTLHFAPVPGRPGSELPLVAITDRNDNRIDFHYTDDGAPAEVVHCGGYRVGIGTYDHRITSYTLLSDPAEPVLLAFDYDDAGNLAKVYNSSGLPLQFTYDAKGRLTRWEDRNNTWYTYEYDTAGRCVFTTGTDRALEYTYTYDTANHRTLATNSLGHTTTYQFNDQYQLIAETDPLGHTTHRTYDRYDRIHTNTDPLGNTTRYAYDNDGNLTTVTRPDGREVSAAYDDHGFLVHFTHADGSQWQQEFDERGNRIAVTDPMGRRTRYEYHSSGGLASVTDAMGNTTLIRCDAAGLPDAVTAPEGGTTRYRRDSFGRPVSLIDAVGATTTLEWSPEGRLCTRVNALGERELWQWDAEGNLLEHTDENSANRRFTYGPFDVLTSRTEPDGTCHTFVRDTELNLVRVVNPDERHWDYTYDPAGRLTEESDFDGRRLVYAYDEVGRLTAKRNPAGQTVSYGYDALGLRTSKKTDDGHTLSYTYDALGRVTRATGPGADVTRTYDALGNVLTETVNGRTLSVTYDPSGRMATRLTPGGQQSAWTYDTTGAPLTLHSGGRLTTFSHDATGRETSRQVAGIMGMDTIWDESGRLIRQRVTTVDPSEDRRVLDERTYTYSPDGQPTSIVDTAGVTQFSLDVHGRVTGVSGPRGSETYAYDRSGDPLTAGWTDPLSGPHAAEGDREYAGTALKRAGDFYYEHDAAGRTVMRRHTGTAGEVETWQYTWDAEDRLVRTVTPEGHVWRYRYDPFGRRIAKHRVTGDDSVVEEVLFTWHETTLVEQVATRDHAVGTSTTTWDYLGRKPLTQIERATYPAGPDATDQRFYAIIGDLVGTPVRLIDEEGGEAWHATWNLWGHTASEADSATTTPLRFPGQYLDAETGWHYNYHRHYDPATGRYTTPDPLGLAPSPNPLAYVRNPQVWTDPLGLEGYLDFYTVQNPEDAARLRGDGNPWPTDPTRGHYGEGVYAWGSEGEAQRYRDLKQSRGVNVEIVHFRVSETDFAKMNRVDVTAMSNADAEVFVDRHSRLFGQGQPHDYDYIKGKTGMGHENFFSKSAFCKLKFT